jgi:predicted nucleic acid-binding protein
VVVDSSALMALVNITDQLHEPAVQVDKLLTYQDWTLLLPREVFAETVNAIGKKLGRSYASLTAKALLDRYDTGDFRFVHGDRGVYDRALKLQRSGKGAPSFVDCLVMALADEYDTSYIFGFDATF